jgi:hypothetical protein
MRHRFGRLSSILTGTALAAFLACVCGSALAATPPPLNLQSSASAASCKAPDTVVYVDNYQGLKVYYASDQSGYTSKPDASAGTSVTGFTCLSIAKANGFTQGLNVIRVTGPNGVTYNLYPTIADAQKAPPAGCGGSPSSNTWSDQTIVYVSSGAMYRLEDAAVGRGLNAYTCRSEAAKGGLKLDATFYKDPSGVRCAGSYNPIVYADNTPGKAEYYEPQQPGYKTKPGSGGYLCEAEAKELGYGQHKETLLTAQKSAASVKCTPASDPIVYFDFTKLTYFPADRTVNWAGATDYGGYACLSDAKSHGFHLLTTSSAQGAGPLPLLPAGSDDRTIHIACDSDAAWFMPAGSPSTFVRESSASYGAGSGAYSCGRYGLPFFGAGPATPADAKIPPPFSCNQMSAPPAKWIQIAFAASTPLTCSYNLDATTINPAPSTACSAPPNAFTFSTGGRTDVMRVSLMSHAWFAIGRVGNPRIGSSALDILCQVGKATGH